MDGWTHSMAWIAQQSGVRIIDDDEFGVYPSRDVSKEEYGSDYNSNQKFVAEPLICGCMHLTFTSFFWGFIDDFYVTGLCAMENLIQIHSESRIGDNDSGENYNRVKDYYDLLVGNSSQIWTEILTPQHANLTLPDFIVEKQSTYYLNMYYSYEKPGLVTSEGFLIPMTQLSYRVDIQDSLAYVTLSQTFVNPLSSTAQVQYSFSVSPDAAFVKLQASINGVVYTGVIKEA